MNIYAVDARYGEMGLPILDVVVASSTEEAAALLEKEEWVKVEGAPRLIGTAIDDTPKVIR